MAHVRELRWTALMGVVLLLLAHVHAERSDPRLVINTWDFEKPNLRGWEALQESGSGMHALVEGCHLCEVSPEECNFSVGFGGSPNEEAETTLDALVMDGDTMDVGGVGCLKRVKAAIKVARKVMEETEHSLLVGEDATRFALEGGFEEEPLVTFRSYTVWREWCLDGHTPNYWRVPHHYNATNCTIPALQRASPERLAHIPTTAEVASTAPGDLTDTIGMVVVDADGSVSAGTSTNGKVFKIAGRVGDSPIAGAGAYADSERGGAAATGDGDIMMRFLPTFHAVLLMGLGMTPQEACEEVLHPIVRHYPDAMASVICANPAGEFGGATVNAPFPYRVSNVEGAALHLGVCVHGCV